MWTVWLNYRHTEVSGEIYWEGKMHTGYKEICMYVCRYVGMYMYVCVQMFFYEQLCSVCVCVCVCVCVYMYTCVQGCTQTEPCSLPQSQHHVRTLIH